MSKFCEIQTRDGLVRGYWQEDPKSTSAVFLGIPFAQPPVGALRFAAPKPPTPWAGVRDACKYGPTPERSVDEGNMIPEEAVAGEEILNLNVFTPAPGDSTAGLPVLVWIHGGGYYSGSPASPWYDGYPYNRDGVVTVTLSYRLGFQGFGMVSGAPANRGVLDWIAGLEWVQDNIKAFGGDPARVTIAGQSAGGGAVLTLLGMESAQHLFTSVHAISGAFGDRPLEDATAFARELGQRLGVEPSVSGLSEVSDADLYKVQQELSAPPSMDYLKSMVEDGPLVAPVVDGEVIVRPTFDSYAAGIGAEKHLLIGTTDDEFQILVAGGKEQFDSVPLDNLLDSVGLTGKVRDAYLTRHPDYVRAGNTSVLGHYLTEGIFHTTVLRVLAARGDAPSWVYRFSYPSPITGLSSHCLDIPFWWDNLNAEGTEPRTGPNPPAELAAVMHQASVNFISQGDPGWPAWSAHPGTVAVFGRKGGPELVRGVYDDAEPLLAKPFRPSGLAG